MVTLNALQPHMICFHSPKSQYEVQDRGIAAYLPRDILEPVANHRQGFIQHLLSEPLMNYLIPLVQTRTQLDKFEKRSGEDINFPP